MTTTKTKVHARYIYKPQGPVLKAFHKARDFIRVLIGPLGSGKTYACIDEILHQIDNQVPDRNGVRRSRWVAARNTYPDLQNTTIKDFREITDPMAVGRFINSSPPRWVAKYKKKDGTTVSAEVLFLAFDIADDEKKARGLQLTGVWLNEMKELARTNCDMLMARVGRFPAKVDVPKAQYHVIGDSNAPDRDHWLAELAKKIKPDGWWFGIQPPGIIRTGGKWQPNPMAENLRNLPDGYYERLIAGRKESWVRKNLANEFIFHSDGRPVHPDFSEDLHVPDYELEPTYGLPIHVGIDFGRTPAAAIMQRQANGQWYILDEVVSVNSSAYKFGGPLKTFIADNYDGYDLTITGDPAGDDMAQTRDETPMDMLMSRGLDCYPAHTNDFEERVSVLDNLLTTIIDGQPAVLVSPRCTTIIRGLAGAYQFERLKVSGDDRFHDKPRKTKESHVVEAIHYGLLGAGELTQLMNPQASQAFQEIERWAPDPRMYE